ncbi:MAG: hypothetical protein J2O44_06960 [Porphyrobacter sp.]|nr:hypothetical protein [Porphyrobacter sp.]
MPEPVSDEDARTRWFVINMTRLVGAVIVVVGILGLRRVIAIPDIAAYAFIAFGLFDVFAVPQILARKWRTPPQ